MPAVATYMIWAKKTKALVKTRGQKASRRLHSHEISKKDKREERRVRRGVREGERSIERLWPRWRKSCGNIALHSASFGRLAPRQEW